MARADYDEWTAEVHRELKARNIDIQAAYDWFSFYTAYHEFDDKPHEAVEDCVRWLQENGDDAS